MSFRYFFEVSIDTKERQTRVEKLKLRLGLSLSCVKGFLGQLTVLEPNGGLGAQDVLFPWTRAFSASQMDQKVLGLKKDHCY